MISILSEDIDNPIQVWLNTPKGYYVGKPLWGQDLNRLLFKNITQVRRELNSVVKDIERDLGSKIAQTITRVDLMKDANSQRYIVITSNSVKGLQYSIAEVI